MKGTSVLDVIRGIMETAGASIKLTVDSNMSQVMTMETSFIVMKMVR